MHIIRACQNSFKCDIASLLVDVAVPGTGGVIFGIPPLSVFLVMDVQRRVFGSKAAMLFVMTRASKRNNK